ncbi:hypothetical protein PMAYCL1PPCAC_25428, partial [Pristionchus mayeri]
VPSLLILADRFQMECVMNETEKYITQSYGIDIAAKLQLADEYRLAALKVRLMTVQRRDHINSHIFQTSSEFANFSEELKTKIESIEFPSLSENEEEDQESDDALDDKDDEEEEEEDDEEMGEESG